MSEPEDREPERDDERGWAAKLLGVFSEVRAGEGGTAFILMATIFLLLFAYYVLKTVREPLVLASAEADLQLVRNTDWPQWLKDVLLNEAGGPQLKAVGAAFQALLLFAYVPAYSWIAARVTRTKLIVAVTIFFVVCLQLFFALRLSGVPMLGFVFYVWVGIFSVSMIAQFWSFGNDLYTEEQGKRLFPIVGIGATAGAPIGSKAADWLYGYLAPQPNDDGEMPPLDAFQQWIVDTELDPSYILLQLPALLLLIYIGAILWVTAREHAIAKQKAQRASDPGPDPEETKEPGEPNVFVQILRSPYLRLIAVVILILNLVNTMGEFLLSEVVDGTAESMFAGEAAQGAWIGSFYGEFYFYVNIAAFVLQAFVVSRLAKYLGLKGVLFALPIVALGTYSLFTLGLGLTVLRWAKTAENSTDYSIMNTGKAMVWLPTHRSAKYRAKQAVDTLLVRIGDVVSAVLFLVGTIALHLGLPGLGAVNLGLVGVWLFLTFLLVRQHGRIQRDPDADPAADPEAVEAARRKRENPKSAA